MILYLNAQSVVGKLNELSCTLSEMEPDIVLITESWCNKEITDAHLGIPGYEMQTDLRRDRENTAGGRGGGLLVYTKTGLQILKLDNNVEFFQHCKSLVRDVTVYLLYRPPNGPAADLTKLANLISQSEKNCIIIGDFNLPNIDWEAGTARGGDKVVLEAVEEALMTQMVDFSTQVRGNILDLVVTNMPERLTDVREEGRLGRSDHSMIVVEVSVGPTPEKNRPGLPDWRRADWDGMRRRLVERDWLDRVKAAPVEAAWKALTSMVEGLVKEFVPERRRRNQNRPPWLTRDILCAIRKKKRIWKRDKERYDKTEYKAQETLTRNLIRNAKRRYEKKLASGGDNHKRQFFAYVKQRTKSRPSIGPLKKDGQKITGDLEMAELLNKCFGDIFTRETEEDAVEPDAMEMDSQLTDVKITVRDVKAKIRKLKRHSAAGPDGIGPVLLQELQDGLAPALAAIFRKSLDSGIAPEDWRVANVTPIFKKGSKSEPGNYRPVSLTSVCCKMLESILKDNMVKHLDLNKLLCASQHGFRTGRSCTTNLLEFLERVTASVDEGKPFDGIFLDFAKAFDKVPIKRLIKKLRAHGIQRKLLKWIQGWLTGRSQRVVLNGIFSSWMEVLSGVPQGSVLGPLLFIIFINDLDLAAGNVETVAKFADDTKIGQTVETVEEVEQLQRALDGLCGWAEDWCMQFNVSKCKVMHFGHGNRQHVYSMNGVPLEKTMEEKDVGVTVSSNLKPSAQCARAANTARAVLGQVTRAFHYRDRHVFVRLYKQYVRPHLEFCTPAWSPWTAGDREKLENVQKKMVGMVSGLEGRHYVERLHELGLQSLEERRHVADMCMMHKIVHGKAELDPNTWFKPARGGGRVTRAAADPLNVRVAAGRLELRRNFFSVKATVYWNEIPSDIKNISSSDAFKRNYVKHRSNMPRPV